jgi:hypothetical protein
MAWCEANGVHFVFGLAQNDRLNAEITSELEAVKEKSERTRQASTALQGVQMEDAQELEPQAPGCCQSRVDDGDANPRFVSPHSNVPSANPATYMRRFTVLGATWRTGSKSASAISMPIAPRAPPCELTSYACGLPRWPTCCCAPCAVCGSNALCQRHLWHHPSQVAQDWRFGAVQRPLDQSRDGISLSGS